MSDYEYQLQRVKNQHDSDAPELQWLEDSINLILTVVLTSVLGIASAVFSAVCVGLRKLVSRE
jgi:hypothetical protein